MKLMKKIITLGMVGMMTFGQCTDVFATTCKLTAGFGRPTEIGVGLFHSMTSYMRTDTKVYCLKATMRVEFTKNGKKLSTYFEFAESEDNGTKRNLASAYKNWTDKGENLAREYDNYKATGHRGYSQNSWVENLEKTGVVTDIYSS